MKYLILAVFAGLFIVNPVFAENNAVRDEKQGSKTDRKNRKIDQKTSDKWQILKSISTNERERLRKLHATDPEAFKKEIAKIVERVKAARQEKQNQNQKIRNLVSLYKNAKDDKTKKEAMEQLRKVIQKIFLSKMQENKKRLESLEKRVQKVREAYEFRQKNADKIIQSRLDTLTLDTNFNW
jgi:uncharacterized protein YjgD (DUF1641 family)